MKQLIALFILLSVSTVSFAQKEMTASGTITNTTGYVTSIIPGGYGNLSIQLVLTKTSGTVAGGAILQASNDGTNYVTVNATNDTLLLADQAVNTKIWNVGISPYLYYRARILTTGTNVTVGTGYYVFRPTR